ncbi:MAB_1171c family putative transporter [Arthrobacter sp. A2-55]|uniref:MAB_1171c family putative transporter n=1 Tax=Arthrobacter sp. A2-55 TaxID=2897337 RepID=UPI0021CD914D|nr:MAB_1171c family putative transporter [Arthrobacter sp. A2-55]MCU6481912.1 hypothetical protein [Arthrobacter sp. A2-55]
MIVSLIIAAALWALSVVKMFAYRRGQDHTVLLCSMAFALSFTTDVEFVARPLDKFLGGDNASNLVGHLLFSCGVYLLSRSILLAAQPLRFSAIERGSRIALVAVLTAQAFTFSHIDAPVFAQHFTTVYGGQTGAVWYAIVEITYTSLVLAMTSYFCLKYYRRMSSRIFRTAFLLTALGCILATCTEILGVEWVVRRHFNDLANLSAANFLHDYIYVLAVLVLTAGLALPSIWNKIHRTSQRKEAARWVSAIEPIWNTATDNRREMRIGSRTTAFSDTVRLHRMLVEIRDALLGEPNLESSLGESALAQIDAAELWLTPRRTRSMEALAQ